MGLEVLLFGIAREIVGNKKWQFVEGKRPGPKTVRELKECLFSEYPQLRELSSLLVAVNEEYAGEDHEIGPSDEIALIPPVSGG